MNKLIAVALILSLSLIGCGALGLKAPPSVCDNMGTGDSILCDIATKNDIHLETAGNFFMVLNMRSIKEGLYTKDQAHDVILGLQSAVGLFEITGDDLRNLVLDYTADYPELILMSPYLGYLSGAGEIKDADRDMLTTWLDLVDKSVQ